MAERLKNIFFTRDSLSQLAQVMKENYPGFNYKDFMEQVFDQSFDSLELTKKMRHTTKCLEKVLPGPYKKNLGILKESAPKIKGFEALCLPDYVALYGINRWDISLEALYHFTKYSTSELAIRPFLNKDPEKVMELMSKWAEDDNPKVRRFASEGCRPRLPWAVAIPVLKKDPGPVLIVLDKLKNDESEDVRRSVANNLNDISKDHPDTVIKICRKWFGKTEKTDKLLKHACRGLLKAGNKDILRIFGYGDPGGVSIKNFKINPGELRIGDILSFSFNFILKEKSRIRLEYTVYYVKSRGQLSKKVFMIKEDYYDKGEYYISRKHSFEERTTRRHYPGEHRIAITANGEEKCRETFILKK
jgi:3-methyladenine DNA glycosylase AlkC